MFLCQWTSDCLIHFKGLFHWVIHNMADSGESLTPSSPVAWTCNKFPTSHVWVSVHHVIYLGCCFSISDLCVIVNDRLLGSMTWAMQGFWKMAQAENHGFRIMWQHSAPSMSISVFIFFCSFFSLTNSSKWAIGQSDSPIKSDSCKWEILWLPASI